MGASLSNTMDRVMGSETKRYRQRMKGDPSVDKALRASLQSEESQFHCDRLELQEHTRMVKEKMRAKAELERINAEVKRATKQTKEVDAMVPAREAEKHIPFTRWGWVRRAAVVKHIKKRVLKC